MQQISSDIKKNYINLSVRFDQVTGFENWNF